MKARSFNLFIAYQVSLFMVGSLKVNGKPKNHGFYIIFFQLKI